jgi:chromosome segregation ATPase
MIPNWLPGWAAAGAAAGTGFGAVKWLLEFFAKRSDAREDRLDADTRFIISNLREELERVAVRLSHAEKEIVGLRESLHDCQDKHSHSEAEVARLTAMMQGYGDARELLQKRVSLDAIQERRQRLENDHD